MKEITKEELIEYFIEQLGNNEILGQVMTIEQIREKLNHNIKGVSYSSTKEGSQAYFNAKDGIVNFDIQQIQTGQEAQVIVHELLHALSSSFIVKNNGQTTVFKVGLKFGKNITEGESPEWNRAINEGITDYIAQKITGQYNRGYTNEKTIYEILSVIVDEKFMLETYLGEIDPKYNNSENEASIETDATNILSEYVMQKYKGMERYNLKYDIKQILRLSEQLNYLDMHERNGNLTEHGRRLGEDLKKEIDNTLISIIRNGISCLEQEGSEKLFDMVRTISSLYYKFNDSERGNIREEVKQVMKRAIQRDDVEFEKLWIEIKNTGNTELRDNLYPIILKRIKTMDTSQKIKFLPQIPIVKAYSHLYDDVFEEFVSSTEIKPKEKIKMLQDMPNIRYIGYGNGPISEITQDKILDIIFDDSNLSVEEKVNLYLKICGKVDEKICDKCCEECTTSNSDFSKKQMIYDSIQFLGREAKNHKPINFGEITYRKVGGNYELIYGNWNISEQFDENGDKINGLRISGKEVDVQIDNPIISMVANETKELEENLNAFNDEQCSLYTIQIKGKNITIAFRSDAKRIMIEKYYIINEQGELEAVEEFVKRRTKKINR